MNPLLSVLIATRNRIPYCINVIETILGFEYQNFELIIQDNSDTLDLKEYLKKNINDKRLVYKYTPPPFSSIDNFNAVIELSRGEYLCLIGDDDGINPEIFKIVEWASKNDVDAILPGLNVMYRWPDACKVLKGYENAGGEISISAISGRISVHDTSKALKNLMKNGGQNYLTLHFPKLYHGIVKKNCMDKIKEQTGHYVGGLSPDIYVAVALTSFIKKILEIDYPITIPGACIAPLNEHIRKFDYLEDAPHFRDRGPYLWSGQIPKFYCADNIWADSALASLRDMNFFQIYTQFNVTNLTIALLKKHKEYSDIILLNYFNHKHANTNFSKKIHSTILLVKKIEFELNALKGKVVNRFSRLAKNVFISDYSSRASQHSYKNVTNICKATENLKIHLINHSLSIEMIIKRLDILYGVINKN